MLLKDILKKIAENKRPILLSNQKGDWSAHDLLEQLPEPMLNVQAHFQPDLYIAEINNKGYLGSVLFKVKNRI